MLLDASVKVPASTSIVVAPSPVGVKVAVYVVPFPFAVRTDKVPPSTVISPTAKLVVTSPASNVRAKVVSFDVEPSATSAAVMVIEGPVLSKVQLNCVAAVFVLPEASVNLPASTSIVVAPSSAGVKVAV